MADLLTSIGSDLEKGAGAALNGLANQVAGTSGNNTPQNAGTNPNPPVAQSSNVWLYVGLGFGGLLLVALTMYALEKK